MFVKLIAHKMSTQTPTWEARQPTLKDRSNHGRPLSSRLASMGRSVRRPPKFPHLPLSQKAKSRGVSVALGDVPQASGHLYDLGFRAASYPTPMTMEEEHRRWNPGIVPQQSRFLQMPRLAMSRSRCGCVTIPVRGMPVCLAQLQLYNVSCMETMDPEHRKEDSAPLHTNLLTCLPKAAVSKVPW